MNNNEEKSTGYYVPKEDRLFGSCILQIRIENEEQHKQWAKYNGGKQRWDFLVDYPAIMRATYDFHTSLDVDILARKVVQLLQMGFQVHAVDWKLKEYKSQLERSNNYGETSER